MLQNHITLSNLLALDGLNHEYYKTKSHFETYMLLKHLNDRTVLYIYVVSHSSLLHYTQGINFSSDRHIANKH